MSITNTAPRRAIILSAGQGSRLLPITENQPKCLIAFSGKTLLEWQIEALAANGIDDIVIVTGFRANKVEALLAARGGQRPRTLFNPFYHVADNLGSCWIARQEMNEDFIILNGDTLVSPDIVARLLAAEQWPITVTVDIKATYDEDDMKVNRDGDRLVAIGKRLTPEETNAESIGMLAFRGTGVAAFRDEVERMMHDGDGVKRWYLRAIDELAPTGLIGTVAIDGLEWAEVDFPADLEIARGVTARWAKLPATKQPARLAVAR
jgi:L-glutamine-phosphate cytidylyltransferase